MSTSRKAPIVIELDAKPAARAKSTAKSKTKLTKAPSPAQALPVPEPQQSLDVPSSDILRSATARSFSWGGLLLALLSGFLVFALSVAAWGFVTDMLVRNIWLGRLALGLGVGVIWLCLLMTLRELAALSRLRLIDGLRNQADALVTTDNLAGVQKFGETLKSFQGRDPTMRWAHQELDDRRGDLLDADGLLAATETILLTSVDQAALREIERSARQVATTTALVPLALADVAVALYTNTRMIRTIAHVYGGRAGLFGSWRLLRAVMAHLVATGAVAIGDDMIGAVAGGGVLSKLSRRFGEGLVNGALTARVGIAAMEVCRPMPFRALPRPRVASVIKRALVGIFG